LIQQLNAFIHTPVEYSSWRKRQAESQIVSEKRKILTSWSKNILHWNTIVSFAKVRKLAGGEVQEF
jgi:hypothetical protein